METPPLLPLTTALGAGLLIGLVYERRKADDPSIIAGLRSHTLAALIGVVSLWLGLPVFAIAVLLCGAFVALGYYRTSLDDPGVTSELALVLSCLIGGLALRAPAVAAGLAVLTAILVFAKSRLHRFSRELISNREVADGLILLAFALIVLPLLLAISPELLRQTRGILAAAAAVLVLGAALGMRRGQHLETPPPTSETRMFRIGHALGFAAMITVVIVVSKLLGHWLGPGGALAATFLAAMAELHSAVAGVANLFNDGVLVAGYARWAVVGLLAASALAKSMVAFTSGGKAYGWRIAIGLGGMTLAAALAATFIR